MKRNIESSDYWRRLADAYFEAETSEEEEAALRRFLATEASAGQEFDALRAVMGYAAVGRRIDRRARRRRTVGFRIRVAAVAAALAAVVVGPLPWLLRTDGNVAYIGGVKYTDDAVVAAQISGLMEDMGETAAEMSVAAQLGDMFNTIEEF